MANHNKQFLIFLGKKIREYRDKMGVSQEKLGEIAKLHRTYIGMIERGEKNITITNLKRIAQALGLHVRDLIDF
ncbi:MAG: helix-turn-helix transcriptional regulator [Patescibacteria group bacterium]|nr:helix-turn-helix transcriptional regulator [Patescibacteria group bacterium]